MTNPCIDCCNSIYQIPTRILCFVLVIAQGGILDYYLITYKSVYWYGWIAADVALGLVFIMTFLISYRQLSLVHHSTDDTAADTGSLPLGYFAWFVYSVFLGIRIFIIYRDLAWKLSEENVFGPNLLKICAASSGLVFLLLLMTHNNTVPGSKRKYFIDELTATVVFDILDSIDLLNIMFNKSQVDSLPDGMGLAIVVIACVNILLPVLPLISLSRYHFGFKTPAHWLIVCHKLCLVFVVNLPFFVMRMLLWHLLNEDISVFPVKNVIMIFIIFHDLYDKKRANNTERTTVTYRTKELGSVTDLDENRAIYP